LFAPGSRLGVIPTNAFRFCSRLQSIVLPSSVKTLEPDCFAECCALVESPLPLDSQVVRIGDRAFTGCQALSSMVLPSSVEYVGESSFTNCRSLGGLTFSSSSNLRELLCCPAQQSGFIPIPDSVEILRLPRGWRDRGERTLSFGVDSRLSDFKVEADLLGGTMPTLPLHVRSCHAFVRVSARSLTLFRKKMEFAWDE
jgi:hypothetical protein